MALEEFYGSIDGDLADVRGRLLTDERVEKFVRMFFDDPAMGQLNDALAAGDMEAAFRAAHTMKGLANSMGFTGLYDLACQLTEALRPNDAGAPTSPDQVPACSERLQAEYDQIVGAFEQSF